MNSIFDYLYPKFKIDKPIRLIELFGGIGSQAKALQRLNADFEHYRYVDFDKYAVASYNAIYDTNFEVMDITKINADDLAINNSHKYIYLLTYSFPCQDLSLAGNRKGMTKGDNTRSGLLWEVERLLKECNELPQVLLMENVPEVIGQKNIDDFNKWQLFLESLGYKSYIQCLNSKDYSIPQNRNRCFMISLLGDYSYTFPEKQELKLRLKDLLEDEVDEKYYLSEKFLKYATDMSDRNGFVRGSRFNPINLNKNDYSYTITTNPGNRPTDNFILVPEATKNGYAKAFEGDGVKIERPHQKRGCVQRAMVHTIMTTNNNCGVVDGLKIRKLTPKECWRLMGFDDEDFDKAAKVNSNTQLYKQAGNSIVVNVLEAIFKELL